MGLACLRDAPWLTTHRMRSYSALLLAFYAAAIVWVFTGAGLADPNGKPIGTDFVSFSTVSQALHHGAIGAIYSPDKLAGLERAVTGRVNLFYAWAYPPIALLIVEPLAQLPYLWSLAAWLLVGLAFYLHGLWRILPRGLTLFAGLAFPAVFLALAHGQNALLSAGLVGAGLALLPAQPILAGIAIGFLSFKPQLGILLPLALISGRHWRAFLAAALTVVSLAGLTVLLYGVGIWREFITTLPFTRAMLEQGLVPYADIQSVFAGTRLLGASLEGAYIAQGVAALAGATATVWVWRRPGTQGLRNAILIVATLLATPFVADYDLTWLALAVAWLCAEGQGSGMLPWDGAVLVGVCAMPLFSRGVAQHTGIALAPPIEAAFLLVLLRRFRLQSLAPPSCFVRVTRASW